LKAVKHGRLTVAQFSKFCRIMRSKMGHVSPITGSSMKSFSNFLGILMASILNVSALQPSRVHCDVTCIGWLACRCRLLYRPMWRCGRGGRHHCACHRQQQQQHKSRRAALTEWDVLRNAAIATRDATETDEGV